MRETNTFADSRASTATAAVCASAANEDRHILVSLRLALSRHIARLFEETQRLIRLGHALCTVGLPLGAARRLTATPL